MTAKARLITPPYQLQQKLLEPGGIEKDKAVADAAAAVENLRQKLSIALAEEVARLEKSASQDGRGDETAVGDLRKIARVIYNLAGTYRNAELQFVAANLLDSMEAMRDRGVSCTAPVEVHARAARLFAAAGDKVSPASTDAVLKQLKGMTEHLQLQRPCSPENCARCPAAPRSQAPG